MPRLVVTGAAGRIDMVEAHAGENLMRALRRAGLPVAGDCNGSLACATCHVILDPDWASALEPPAEDEAAMLDTVFGLAPTSRLSCQIRVEAADAPRRLALPS